MDEDTATINVTYTVTRSIEDTIYHDIGDEVHEAAVDGVVECGGYDVEVQSGSDNYISVSLSGDVEVFVESEYHIEQWFADNEPDVDFMDIVIEDIQLTGDWGTRVSIDFFAKVEKEVEHNTTVPLKDITIDVRTALRESTSPTARTAIRDLVTTLVGAEFMDAVDEGTV